MTLIEKYLFRQLLVPVLAAVAALLAVGVLSQSLSALDIIVERGQSAWVLFKVTFLALPLLVSMILPIAVFVGALVALNRLHTEQEIVVCFAGGLSRWRVISPAIRLGVLVTLAALVVNLWIQPASYRAMRQEMHKVRTDLAATLVREGEFAQAAEGLTVYTQRIDQNGLLRNLFIHVERGDGSATVYTAQQGRITKVEGRPALVMRRGSSQVFGQNGVLNFLSFDEYLFDLSPFITNDERLNYKTSDRWLHELFFPNLENEWERKNRLELLAEGHSRLASPLYNLAFMSLALAGVLGGAFSRTGYGRRIAQVGAAAAFVRILGFGVLAACADNAWANLFQYVVPIATTWIALRVIFRQKVRRPVPLASDQPGLLSGAAA
ncbi:MAG TPA: LPS export ABC transporter permease LptF [Caulobacteraceae bacterium]|nr:LPS export ABC transporter permease LptF [Caulobacteraceae bacterium]